MTTDGFGVIYSEGWVACLATARRWLEMRGYSIDAGDTIEELLKKLEAQAMERRTRTVTSLRRRGRPRGRTRTEGAGNDRTDAPLSAQSADRT